MTVLITGYRGFVGTHLCQAIYGASWIGLDLKDGADVTTVHLPEPHIIKRVYHLAAQVDAYCQDPVGDARTNIMGTLRILEKYGDKVVYASSSMVNYPDTPYAISKLAAEHYARMYGAAIVRFCNLYGEGGHSVIDRFAAAEVLTIYGEGKQRRTFAPVTVAVNAMLEAKPGTTTIVPGKDWSVMEIAIGTGKPFVHAPPRQFDLLEGTQR